MKQAVREKINKKLYLAVSGVTTICLTQCYTSPSYRVDQVVDCGLCNVGPLLFNGCEVAGYWQELEHAVVYADPEHPKHR